MNTPVNTATSTTAPTGMATLTPTLSQSPTATSTLTPTITFTPLPTYPPDEAKTRLAELMQNNGGCQYPCFWGEVIPGETSWDELLAFLAPYNLPMETTGGYDDVTSFRFELPFSPPYPTRPERKYGLAIRVRENKVFTIAIHSAYTLREIIKLYGISKEIWFHVDSLNYGISTYDLYLFYPDYSFYIVFDGDLNYFDRPEKYTLCETDLADIYTSASIKVWPADFQWTIDEATEPYYFRGLNRKTLETVINEDLNQFLEEVVDENINACLTTDSEY